MATGSRIGLLEFRLRVFAVCCGVALWAFYSVRPSTFVAGDFPQFYVLARLTAEGRLDELQDGPALSRAVKEFASPDLSWTVLPVYPPQVGLALAPLARVPYRTGERLWLLVWACVYVLMVWRLLRDCDALRPHRLTAWLLALAAPAFFQVVLFGQLSVFALTATVLGFAALASGRSFAAGMAFGLLAYKPQYGLALAVIFALTRSYPVIAGALLVGLAQFAFAWAATGTAVMLRFADVVLATPSVRGTLQSQPHFLQSLLPLALLLPGQVAPVVVYAVTSVAALAMTWVVWTHPVPVRLKHSALILCGVLISPHFYVYDLVLLVPVYFWLTDWLIRARARSPRVGRDLDECIALLYLWPVLGPALTWAIRINLGPFVMMFVLYRLAQHAAGATDADAENGVAAALTGPPRPG